MQILQKYPLVVLLLTVGLLGTCLAKQDDIESGDSDNQPQILSIRSNKKSKTSLAKKIWRVARKHKKLVLGCAGCFAVVGLGFYFVYHTNHNGPKVKNSHKENKQRSNAVFTESESEARIIFEPKTIMIETPRGMVRAYQTTDDARNDSRNLNKRERGFLLLKDIANMLRACNEASKNVGEFFNREQRFAFWLSAWFSSHYNNIWQEYDGRRQRAAKNIHNASKNLHDFTQRYEEVLKYGLPNRFGDETVFCPVTGKELVIVPKQENQK
jgi:hypothetical protein